MAQPNAGTGLGEERRAQGRAHAEHRSLTDELPHLGGRQPPGVRIARVTETGAGPLAALSAPEGPRGVDRLEQEHVLEFEDLSTLLFSDQHLVELLARSHADELDLAAGRHRLDEVEDAHTGDLRHEDLAAPHDLGAPDRERDALLEADPEPGHARIGHRDDTRRTL